MVDPTFIEVDDPIAGADLVRRLGRHGLSAALVREGSRWQVEVKSLGEDRRSFFVDLGVTLAAWNGVEGGTRGRTAA